jgi:hypothetical protein
VVWFKRIQYKLHNLLEFLKRLLNKANFSPTDILAKIFFILLITALSFNVYTAYNKGVANIRGINEEEGRLDNLLTENQKLATLERYYGSLEYKRIYARDKLNLAQPNETLYYVDRPDAATIEQLPQTPSKVSFDNNLLWWKKLILGW